MLYSDKPIVPSKLTFNDVNLPVYTFNTIIVGSGVAGLNAAYSLFDMGQRSVAILTEGMKTGASKNSGDNNQTYYKLSASSSSPDSARKMAEALFNGGSMDGDIALTEAASSLRCFHRLADIGADFAQDKYGGFLDYPSDESKISRTSDAGKFTARKMAQALEKQVLDRNIPIFNRFRVVSIIKDTDDKGGDAVVGLLAIDRDMQKDYAIEIEEYRQKTHRSVANKGLFDKIRKRMEESGGSKKNTGKAYNFNNDNFYVDEDIEEPIGNEYGYTLFRTVNIVYAVGGPGGLYGEKNSVYPSDVTSSLSPALAIGAYGRNITETRFGIAVVSPDESSTVSAPYSFKWKMSGVLQKAVPRYISTDADGNDEREFLDGYFSSAFDMIKAVKEKASNWCFDTRKLKPNGSSLIDFAVYAEKNKGRKVYLDYFYNPECVKPENIGDGDDNKDNPKSLLKLMSKEEIAYRPYERLIKLDFETYKLFLDNGIDLKRTPVEINICAEHLNGGIACDINSESNTKRFFAVGEASAVFGVYAPDGSSLSATQVTSFRAAQKIAKDYDGQPLDLTDFWVSASEEVYKYIVTARQLLKNAVRNVISENIFDMRNKYQTRFAECGMIVRPLNDVLMAIADCVMDMANFINENAIDDISYLADVFINHDMLVTQYVFLNAIKNYIIHGGRSRGGYLICEDKSDIFEKYSETGDFKDVFDLKITNRYRKSISGFHHKNIEEDIEQTDFRRYASYIKVKNYRSYDIEFFMKEVRAIPSGKHKRE